jgi:SOS-response transcriptional repressor LexA
MFELLCDNLNLLMAERGISAVELARRTGVPASTIKKIRNRYDPNPTLTTLWPLAKYFAVTLGQLAGDEPLTLPTTSNLLSNSQQTCQQVHIISWIDAMQESRLAKKDLPTIATENFYSAEAFAIIVTEDNWENLAPGTILLIDPRREVDHGDLVITYKKNSSAATLRKILMDDDQIYLKPFIPSLPVIAKTSEHIILGPVVEYKKQLKK